MINKSMTISKVKVLNDSISIAQESDINQVLEMMGLKEQAYKFRDIRIDYKRIYDITLAISILGKYPRNIYVMFGYVGRSNGGNLKYDFSQSRTGGLCDLLDIKSVDDIKKAQKTLGINENDTMEEALDKLITNIPYLNIKNVRLVNDICCCASLMKEVLV